MPTHNVPSTVEAPSRSDRLSSLAYLLAGGALTATGYVLSSSGLAVEGLASAGTAWVWLEWALPALLAALAFACLRLSRRTALPSGATAHADPTAAQAADPTAAAHGPHQPPGPPLSAKDLKLRGLLQAAFEQSKQPMVLSDSLDRIVAVNPAFARLAQGNPADMPGQPAELLGLTPLRAAHMAGIDVALRKDLPWSGDSAIIGAGGQSHDLWLGVSTVRDAERRITHHWRVFQDVRPLKDHIQQLADQARLDTLTGLPNRRSFGERLFRAMARARRHPRTLALMCVDLDGFKSVNDVHGHQVGDELLVQVARRLEACVRTTDSVCRMGGDEFMLILEGAGSTQEIELIGQRVLRCLTEGYAIHDRHLNITPSIGAVVHDGHESEAELVRRADATMYAAKREGKCRMVLAPMPQADEAAPASRSGPSLSLASAGKDSPAPHPDLVTSGAPSPSHTA